MSYLNFEAVSPDDSTSRDVYDMLTTANAFQKIGALFPDRIYRFIKNYFNLPIDPGNDVTSGTIPGYVQNGFLGTADAKLDVDSSIGSSPLCQNCAAMLEIDEIWQNAGGTGTEYRRLPWDGKQLQKAAASGCHLCFLNVRQLRHAYPDLEVDTIISASYMFWRGDFGSTSLLSLGRTETGHGLKFLLDIEDDEQQLQLSYLLECLPESSSPRSTVSYKHPNTSTSSLSSLEQITDWLRFCDTHHPVCRRYLEHSARKLPTRLLKICGDAGDRLQLVTTGDLPGKTTYITLSHCWGQTSFKHFIESRDPTYFDDIRTASLPRLFQDAITVAVSMQVQYIWIDSFCIKQSSHDDWVTESARMGDVYRFSLCNIAAARSLNSDHSMFADRESLEIQPCVLEIPKSATDSDHRKRWVAYQYDLLWKDNIERAPLSQRAWVLQEVVLAPRNVQFGRTQLFWECEMLRACETFPRGIPAISYRKLRTGAFCLQFELQHTESTDLQWQQIWKRVIDEYSQKLLTQTAKDKLPALSGLAKSLADPTTYFAGLWKPDIEYQLLWRCTDSLSSVRAPQSGLEYQAPTWSWASVNGPVNYVCRLLVNSPEVEMLARVQSIVINRPDADLTGRVGEDSYLTISAPLIRANIGFEEMEGTRYLILNGATGDIKWDCQYTNQSEYYFLAVELKIKPSKGDKHKLLVGLLLCESSIVQGAFERVAYVALSNHVNAEGFDNLIDNLRNPGQILSHLVSDHGQAVRTEAAEAYDFAVCCVKIV